MIHNYSTRVVEAYVINCNHHPFNFQFGRKINEDFSEMKEFLKIVVAAYKPTAVFGTIIKNDVDFFDNEGILCVCVSCGNLFSFFSL